MLGLGLLGQRQRSGGVRLRSVRVTSAIGGVPFR